jgi:hypothetical protein
MDVLQHNRMNSGSGWIALVALIHRNFASFIARARKPRQRGSGERLSLVPCLLYPDTGRCKSAEAVAALRHPPTKKGVAQRA